jgi:hypothetical protein
MTMNESAGSRLGSTGARARQDLRISRKVISICYIGDRWLEENHDGRDAKGAERRAARVGNLLIVPVDDREARTVVDAGSLYQ